MSDKRNSVNLKEGGDTPEKKHQKKSPLSILLAVLFYFFVSITLVFVNKTVLSGSEVNLEAPLFLTWTQLVVAVLCCVVMSSLKVVVPGGLLDFFPAFEYKLSKAWKIMPLTLVFLGMIVFNNLCLKYVEVSFYQIARSLTIVFSIIVSVALTGQWPASPLALVACVLVVCGYGMGTSGEINVSIVGVCFGLLSSLFVALYSIRVKSALAIVDNNTWKLMIYSNMNAALCMPLLFVYQEWQPIVEYQGFGNQRTWVLFMCAGLLGFLINIASFLQIKYTSPLTHNVSGTVKACVQTGLAVVWFKNPTSNLFWVGFALTIFGSAVYTYARFNAPKK